MTSVCATLSGRFLLLTCLAHGACAAPPCDENLAPDDEVQTGYRLREPNTRCEGFYKAPVSAPAPLELVALTRGNLRFDASSKTLPLKSSSQEAVRLRGAALPEKTHYRLDGLIPAAGELRWNLSDAVLPRNLRPEDLGLYGRLAAKPEVYVPISVGPEPALNVRVRDPHSFDKASWRYASRNNGKCETLPDWTALPSLPTGDLLTIPLPEQLTGEICLEVATLPQGQPNWKQERWFIRLGD